MTDRPDQLPAATGRRDALDREVAAAVAPLGEVLQLSRDAAGAMRTELQRLEDRFCEIRQEADSICAMVAGPERSDWVEQLCRQAGSAEQRLRDAIGEVSEQIDELETRGARLMRTCDQAQARQAELSDDQAQRQAEIERLSEMPLARIEAAADAAAARLEALIEQAAQASARIASAAGEHSQLESALGDAAAELAPWAPLVQGAAPGPVADLLNLARAELRQEIASLDGGLARLAEAIVLLAGTRPARARRAPAKAAASQGKSRGRRPAQLVEAKPARPSASARAATSAKSVARGNARKGARRAPSARSAARSGARARPRKPAGAVRKAAGSRRR